MITINLRGISTDKRNVGLSEKRGNARWCLGTHPQKLERNINGVTTLLAKYGVSKKLRNKLRSSALN